MCMCVYVYVYVWMCACMYMCIVHMFPLGPTSAGFDSGSAPLCFHLYRMNANLQEKILDTMMDKTKMIPNMP